MTRGVNIENANFEGKDLSVRGAGGREGQRMVMYAVKIKEETLCADTLLSSSLPTIQLSA